MLTWSKEIVKERGQQFIAEGVRMARGKLGMWRVAFCKTGDRFACTLALSRGEGSGRLVKVLRDLAPEGRTQAAKDLYAIANASEAKGACDTDDGEGEQRAAHTAGQDQPGLAAP